MPFVSAYMPIDAEVRLETLEWPVMLEMAWSSLSSEPDISLITHAPPRMRNPLGASTWSAQPQVMAS